MRIHLLTDYRLASEASELELIDSGVIFAQRFIRQHFPWASRKSLTDPSSLHTPSPSPFYSPVKMIVFTCKDTWLKNDGELWEDVCETLRCRVLLLKEPYNKRAFSLKRPDNLLSLPGVATPEFYAWIAFSLSLWSKSLPPHVGVSWK